MTRLNNPDDRKRTFNSMHGSVLMLVLVIFVHVHILYMM